jgi:hypothetical protein
MGVARHAGGTVDAEAKDLAAKRLATLAARKAAKKVAKPAAPAAVKLSLPQRRQPRRQSNCSTECVQRFRNDFPITAQGGP